MHSNLIIWGLFMYSVRLHVQINHFIFHLGMPISIRSWHWNQRHPVILLLLSHFWFRKWILSYFLTWFQWLWSQIFSMTRFVSWKLRNKEMLHILWAPNAIKVTSEETPTLIPEIVSIGHFNPWLYKTLTSLHFNPFPLHFSLTSRIKVNEILH